MSWGRLPGEPEVGEVERKRRETPPGMRFLGLNALVTNSSKVLVDNGIHVTKNLHIEELVRDKQYGSILVVTPLKVIGAIESLIRPIALAPGKE